MEELLEPGAPVAAGMDKQMVALLLKTELKIPAAEVAVPEMLAPLPDKRLVVVVPVLSSSRSPILITVSSQLVLLIP
jgi:hypothetical protein